MQNIIQTNRGSGGSDGMDEISIQVNSELITIKRNNEQIATFLWSLKEELMNLNIQIPDQVLSLDNEEMEQLLSHIASSPKLVNTEKVKRFFNTNKKEPTRIKVSAQIIKTCRTMKSTISIHNPEMVPYIEAFGYSQLVAIADGATKAVFKAKNLRKQFVAVKVTKLEQKHNQEEFIMKEVEKKMSRALFGGFLKVNRLIRDQDNRLLISQQELANKTLRDIILQKRVKNQLFSQFELKKLIKDLVESLYHMHVQNLVAHRDIKPHNIFYMEHRYSFGDYGEAEKKRANILSTQIKIKMTELKGTPMYMEPRLLKLWNKMTATQYSKASISLTHTFSAGDSFFQYDPFKADVYSLGLVFLELCLHNLGYTLDEQMENILFYQRDEEFFKKVVTSIDLRSKDQKYIFFGQYLYQLPNLLEVMINEDQNLRITTFNLALLSTPKQTILSHILTPFTDIFLPNKTLDDQEKGIYTVEYNYKGMIYRGQFVNDKREGYGVIYSRIPNLNKIRQLVTEESEEDSGYKSYLEKSYDLYPIYQGNWKNDLPHGEGKLALNDSQNRYEGEFIRGMFSGQGGLYFGNQTMMKCLWRGNYNQYILKPLTRFAYARFRFRIVCPISLTIAGFQQKMFEQETDQARKEFIVQMQEQHSSLIKDVLNELILAHKRLQINKIEISRNLLHRYSEFIISSQTEYLHFVFAKDVDLQSWFLTRIVESMNVQLMKILHLNKSSIGSEPFYAMTNKLRCFNLTQLDLSNCCFISSNSLNKFFSTSIVNSLTKLNLTNTLISNDTMRIFAQSRYLVRLRQLVIRGCLGITDYALKIFIQSPNVKQIELFDIGHTSLSQGFTQGFLWQNQFKKLRRLKIDFIRFQEEDIVHLCQLPVLHELTQFHADPIWIRHLDQFQKLRILTLKGDNKVKMSQFMSFLHKWEHTRLDVHAINITKQQQNYEFYQSQLPKLKQSKINSLTIGCKQKDLFYVFELLRMQIKTMQVDMDSNFSIFKEEFENIKARKWSIGEIVFKYNKHVLEYIISILQLDFSAVKIDSMKIVGCHSEKKNKIFEQMEDNKIRFLQFNEMLKKMTSVIKAKTVKIQEILYTDAVIAEMVKSQLHETVETLVINNTKNSVRNMFTMSFDDGAFCLTQTQTLDQAFHALSVSECLTQLQGLNLFKRQNVGEKGLAHIINSKYCENIKQLNLSYTDITSNIFNLLINSQHLHLNKLALNGIKTFNYQDLEKYIACDNAKHIKKLSLKDTNLHQLDVFFLQLTLDSLQQIDIKFDPSLEHSHVNIQTLDIKYKNLKKIYLDFYNCQLKKIVQKIFVILSSPALQKLKLNLRCCKQKDLEYYQISEMIFLKYLKTKKFKEFRIYFDSTTIFETSFIIYLQTISTYQLDLSFERVMYNHFIEKLSFIFPNFNIKVISLNFSESNLDNNAIDNISTMIKGMKRVQQLNINFSKSSYIINWTKIIDSFSALFEIRKLNLNFADCKVGDQFESMVHWLDHLTKKRKIELTLDLAHCQRIKSDKVFGKLAQLLSKDWRFNSKIRLDVTRFSNIPLDFKYKLIQLNHLSEKYELLVDSSDK